jgi:choline-sulfatase
MLGERGLWFKMAFFEGAARVPLVVRLPGRARAGTRVARPVSLLDLMPTLLALAGAEGPTAARLCPECGAPAAPRDAYCRRCGAELYAGAGARQGRDR